MKHVEDARALANYTGWGDYSITVEEDDELYDPILHAPSELNPSPDRPHTVYMMGYPIQLN
ncbi:hypothetical protein [Spirosoma fluviale]|uniref:Uncharacterized protein n=1 Tax=Spirosoma fluviale TaxID=1597977 RepID=A0A286FCL9_9BACT|nr:hypothetical protein [Spirosoma fluviale]SOD80987.1 hypothetical protein SAMN06269250_1636 [Spirosoma fluviale]